jgi:hypothetical protein
MRAFTLISVATLLIAVLATACNPRDSSGTSAPGAMPSASAASR